MEIEYDLNFETKAEPVKVINAVSNHDPLREPNVEMQLQKTLDQMMKHMESLEMKLQAGAEGTSDVHYSSRCHRSGNQKGSHVRYSQTGQVCWVCALQTRLPSVKLQWVSPISGRLAKEVTYIHRSSQPSSINAIIHTYGFIGQAPRKILLDSGAAVSVVSYESFTDVYCQRLVESAGAVGANGMPLDVVGRTTMIIIGIIQCRTRVHCDS